MAINSFGIAVTVGGSAVGELTDVSIGGTDVNMIDVTTHGSAGGYREFIGGLKDSGTLEMTGKFVKGDAGQVELRDNPGVASAVVVTFSDGTTAAFDSIIGPYTVSNPLDDAMEFNASVKITGAITYTAST